jgi:hypothetical protein
MPEREEPDLDQVRGALRAHDERERIAQELEEREHQEPPEAEPSGDDDPE